MPPKKTKKAKAEAAARAAAKKVEEANRLAEEQANKLAEEQANQLAEEQTDATSSNQGESKDGEEVETPGESPNPHGWPQDFEFENTEDVPPVSSRAGLRFYSESRRRAEEANARRLEDLEKGIIVDDDDESDQGLVIAEEGLAGDASNITEKDFSEDGKMIAYAYGYDHSTGVPGQQTHQMK